MACPVHNSVAKVGVVGVVLGQAGIRILVTGGAGFVGSHLCDRLLSTGAVVVCLDNLETGFKSNLADAMRSPRFTFIEGDVRGRLPDGRFDQIYNLACPASPPQYQRDAVGTMKTSVLGAINVLERGLADGARVLQASTSEVYGDPDVHPQPEEYVGLVSCVGPRACYDEGKRAAETLFYDYCRQHGVEVRVARIFNTYGPRMSPEDGRCIPNFITQALAGEPITVYGDGSQTRSFCYVDDMVDALLLLMNAPGKRIGPVNLGNPVEHTILEMAEIVKARVGSTSSIVMRDLPADDPKIRRPDIARAERDLGWRPSTALAEGLDRTIAWARGQMRHKAPGAARSLRPATPPEPPANPFRKSDDQHNDQSAVTSA